MTRFTLLLATRNAHKVAEIRSIFEAALGQIEFDIVSALDYPEVAEPEENAETFEGNALLKARYWARETGLVSLADDSGLEIDALGGRPGVRSARYAATPEARIDRVLNEMKGIEPEGRTARFVCVAALADASGRGVTTTGRVEGWITQSPYGKGGFGYDPIFEPRVRDRHAGYTFAEMSEEEKNKLSHRGIAMSAMAKLVQKIAAGADIF